MLVPLWAVLRHSPGTSRAKLANGSETLAGGDAGSWTGPASVLSTFRAAQTDSAAMRDKAMQIGWSRMV